MIFLDRSESGRLLGQRLSRYANRNDVLVLALPRGGVPVGMEVARTLRAPFDVFLVRKLGAPGQKELAIGAISSGDMCVLDEETIRTLGISSDQVETIVKRERVELERRERLYRGNHNVREVRGRMAILVDDGMATGLTMRAAARALRRKGPKKIIVAVPVASPDACREVSKETDEVVCLFSPPEFLAVGQWYRNFSQVEDAEVRELLDRANMPVSNDLV